MADSVTFVVPPNENLTCLLKFAGIRCGTLTEAKVVMATTESVLHCLPEREAELRACLVLYGRFTVAAVKEIAKQHGKHYNITVVSVLSGPEQLNVVSGHHAAELNCVLNALGKHEYLGSNPAWAAMLSLTERHLYTVQTILAAESLAIGAKAGLDTQILYAVICGAAGSSWAFKSCGPDMLHASESTAGVTVEVALADLTESCLAAKKCSLQMPLASMSRQLLVTAGSLGLAGKNISAVAKVYCQLGNVSLEPTGSKSSQPSTRSAKPNKVAFIGLGAMGLGMANVLLQAGFNVHGFDVYPPSIDKFTEMGGKGGVNVAEAVKDAEVVVLMVVNAIQAADVLFGLGAAKAMSPGAVICLMSTVSPSAAAELDLSVQALGLGLGFIDCPVSGGTSRAAIGDLTILASGRDKDVTTALAVLQALSAAKGNTSNLFIVDGGVGKGSAVKLVNQHLAATQIISTAEALALVAEQGIPLKIAHAILQRSAGNSWMLGDRGGKMLAGLITPPTSTVTIFVKDASIVVDEAQVLGVPAFMAVTAQQQFIAGVARGWGGHDDSSIVRLIREHGVIANTV